MSAPNNNNNGQLGGKVPTIGNITAAQAHAKAQQLQNQPAFNPLMASLVHQHTPGGAAAPGGTFSLGPPPSVPPIPINLESQMQWQHQSQMQLQHQFFVEKPELRQFLGRAEFQKKLNDEFEKWNFQRHQAFAAAAARPRSHPTITPAARLASTSAATTTSLQQQALDSQNQALKKLSGQFAFLSKPLSNEEKMFLPNNRLTSLAKKAYGDLAVGKLTSDAAAGMKMLAADFSKETISYAIAAARRKRVNRLDPGDVAVYLQQTWGIELPGFSITKTTTGVRGERGGGVVAPYKRLSASEVHKARLAAVRRGNVAQTRLGVPGSSGSVPSGVSPMMGSPSAAGAGTTTGGGSGGGGVKGIRKGVQKKKITSKAAYAASLAARERKAGASESEENDDDREESGDEMEEDMPDIM